MKHFQNNNQLMQDLISAALSNVLGETIIINSERVLGGGCINHAAKLETNAGNFFLKWNDKCPTDSFLREAESLWELKKAAGDYMVIPEVFAARQVDETPGFLILEYLDNGQFSEIDDEKLGRGLAKIHQYENSQFGFYNNNYCGETLQNNQWKTSWVEFYRDNRLGFLLKQIENNRPFDLADKKLFVRLLEKLPDLLPCTSQPVLIHGDLWSGNYLFTQNGPALIDPAVSYCDREMEFGMITLFGGFSQRFYDAYNEENPLSDGWKQRNRLYQLYHILNHYLLFGGNYLAQAKLIAGYYCG